MTPTTDSAANANGSKTIFKQSTLLNLDNFEEVTLRKESTFTPVTNANEALARVGNDSKKLLEAINKGLESFARQELADNPEVPWRILDEDGKLSDSPFQGTPADTGKVNAIVLTMAKTIFGYNKDMSADQKRAAKDQAVALIKSNAVMMEGLKRSSAVTADAE